jgi:hypothetical protein
MPKFFYKSNATNGVVDTAGEKAIALIYGGNSNEDIKSLRYKIFTRKVSAATSFVKPHEIQPTSAALVHHSRRVPTPQLLPVSTGNQNTKILYKISCAFPTLFEISKGSSLNWQ